LRQLLYGGDVRKIAAITAADNGATVHQLMAIFGWKTSQMAEYYTREANRRRLARERCAHAWENAAATSYPRTFAFCSPHLGKTKVKSAAYFLGGAVKKGNRMRPANGLAVPTLHNGPI
jgi:hypothetical protein